MGSQDAGPLPGWAEQQAGQGIAVELVDIGQAFARKVEERRAAKPIAAMERRGSAGLMDSLRTLAREAISGEITRPLESGLSRGSS